VSSWFQWCVGISDERTDRDEMFFELGSVKEEDLVFGDLEVEVVLSGFKSKCCFEGGAWYVLGCLNVFIMRVFVNTKLITTVCIKYCTWTR